DHGSVRVGIYVFTIAPRRIAEQWMFSIGYISSWEDRGKQYRVGCGSTPKNLGPTANRTGIVGKIARCPHDTLRGRREHNVDIGTHLIIFEVDVVIKVVLVV